MDMWATGLSFIVKSPRHRLGIASLLEQKNSEQATYIVPKHFSPDIRSGHDFIVLADVPVHACFATQCLPWLPSCGAHLIGGAPGGHQAGECHPNIRSEAANELVHEHRPGAVSS